MQYRVKFSTYDKELAEILDRLGSKRAKFVEIAVGYFVRTMKGREILAILGNEKADKSPVAKNPQSVFLKTKKGRTVKSTESVFLKPGNMTVHTGKNPQSGLIEKQTTDDIEKETYAETEDDNVIDLDKLL